MRNSPTDTEVSEEGEGRGSPDAGAEIPCTLWLGPHWSRFFPVACGEMFPTAGRYGLKEAAAHEQAKLEEIPDRNNLEII